MNRNQRRALKKLPTTLTTWEIGLVSVPVTVEGVETEGMLVVAERETGQLRAAGPLVKDASLWSVLESAFTAPAAPCAPGRPHRVLCADPALAIRLRAVLGGLRVVVEQVAAVPAVDEVVASLIDHFGEHSAPGITVQVETWSVALEGLARVAPWRQASDRVVFRFDGALELLGRVAIVIGLAGEQLGVVLYSSEADYQRFLDHTSVGSSSALAGTHPITLFLDPASELSASEVEACRSKGLMTSDGLFPRLLAFQDGEPHPAQAHQQSLMLAAIQGITALVRAAREDLEVVPVAGMVPTRLGPLEVSATPWGWEDLSADDLIDVDHAIGVMTLRKDADGPVKTVLLVKLAKHDAERLALSLLDVDGLRFERRRGGLAVYARVGGTDVGRLVVLPNEADSAGMEHLSEGMLCVSAGGSKRKNFRPQDVVLLRDVMLVCDEERGGVRHDPVFDLPIAQWPKISQALVSFVEPLMNALPERSETTMRVTFEIASSVWNAVVLADYCDELGPLEDVRHLMMTSEPDALGAIDRLIERKRRVFGGDPRIMDDVVLRVERGEPRVSVKARLPSGVSVGGVP